MAILYRAHTFPDGYSDTGQFENPYLKMPRKPRTSPEWMHEAADHWFHNNFRTKFRSGALFGTGNIEQAKKYLTGDAVLISVWPTSPYKLCYSPDVYDLFNTYVEMCLDGEGVNSAKFMNQMGSLGYKFFENSGFEEATASGYEVMIAADTFGYKVVQVTE